MSIVHQREQSFLPVGVDSTIIFFGISFLISKQYNRLHEKGELPLTTVIQAGPLTRKKYYYYLESYNLIRVGKAILTD